MILETATDVSLGVARRIATAWEEEAARRRRISQHDPVAETLVHCAAELVEELRTIDAPGAMRTVEQYARDHGVVPPTIRKWIAKGELDAVPTAHGWRISRTARRVKRKVAA